LKLLTLARDLQRRKARERSHLFVAEGIRAGEELLAAPLTIEGALASPALTSTSRGAALRAALDARRIDVLDVTERELASAASTESPQGVVLIAQMPQWSLETLPRTARPRILVLDGVQDPGNVGTMLRTAAAFDVLATLALPGTVDLWNAKVVRSAMGALFHRPAFPVTWEDLQVFLRARDIPVWGADAAGDSLDGVPSPERVAIAVGNEGGGLSAAVQAAAERLLAIPIAPHIESLNVAVATGILLYRFRP